MPARAVPLTAAECWLILDALHIAAEDGSIFGAREPGDGEFEALSAELDRIAEKMKTARAKLGAKHET